MSLPLEAPVAPIAPAVRPGRYFIRHRRARRYILRVEPDGRLRITIPRGGSRREAEEFAVRHDEWVRDYVLVHELMHLKRLDHSPRFWTLVEAAYPAYRNARAWLRLNGPGLR